MVNGNANSPRSNAIGTIATHPSTPTIVAGRVFIGVDTGAVYSLDAATACVYWSFQAEAGVRNAISIGLLPDLPLSRIQYVGNTSIWGAKLAALSTEAFRELHAIRKKTTYYDLLGSNDYVDQFRQAMFLPHTSIELCPSLKALEPAYA